LQSAGVSRKLSISTCGKPMSSPAPVSGSYRFGPFRLDPHSRVLDRAGTVVPLAPRTFDLLHAFLRSGGRLLTKQELLGGVWDDVNVEEASLAFQVSTLRKALGEQGITWIETVPKHGYRFIADVETVEASGATGVEPSEPVVPPHPVRPPRLRRLLQLATHNLLWLAVAAAAVVGALAIWLLPISWNPGEPDTFLGRFTIALPDSPVGRTSVPLAQVSPDGRHVAFILERIGVNLGVRYIWLRPFATAEPEAILGTENATSLFWSPDSRQVAFTTFTSLKKLTIANRTVETLCEACRPGHGGSWSRDGLLLFASTDGTMQGIPATGGKAEPMTTLDRGAGEVAHIAPHFLPDGRRFLYAIRREDRARSGLYIGTVGSSDAIQLLPGEHSAIYAAPGYLLFTQSGNIVARPFDAERLEFTGAAAPLIAPSEYHPIPILGGDIALLQSSGVWPNFSTSDTGVLAYAVAEHPETQFLWVSRTGEVLETIGPRGLYQTFDLSPDGQRLVFSRLLSGTSSADTASLWVRDLTRGVSSRLTFGASSYYDPRWGPGDWVAANRTVPPPLAIVRIQPDGRESLLRSPREERCILDDVSSDGRYLLCRMGSGQRLMAFPVGGRGDAILVRDAPVVSMDQARFSPDDRWIAYNTFEAGNSEVYLTAFPPRGQPWRVSLKGGFQPTWRRDGQELYYLGLDGALNAVAFRAGDTPQFSAPIRLFETGLSAPSPWVEQYDASADGQRFLVLRPVENRVRNSIGLIINWPTLLEGSGPR
jgi:eukaryotic-like serine/threonine-protein kinase